MKYKTTFWVAVILLSLSSIYISALFPEIYNDLILPILAYMLSVYYSVYYAS